MILKKKCEGHHPSHFFQLERDFVLDEFLDRFSLSAAVAIAGLS
jgi:hypothetical protein